MIRSGRRYSFSKFNREYKFLLLLPAACGVFCAVAELVHTVLPVLMLMMYLTIPVNFTMNCWSLVRHSRGPVSSMCCEIHIPIVWLQLTGSTASFHNISLQNFRELFNDFRMFGMDAVGFCDIRG